MDFILYALVALLGFIFYKLIFASPGKDKDKLGIEGKLIWIDKGRDTKPFFNRVFQVLGKPDLMYRTGGGVLAVEYKSRYGQIYDSDIVQAKSAALAARGEGYLVNKILVKTERQEKYFHLPKSDKALYKEIKEYVTLARQAKIGERMKPVPAAQKCKGCAFNNGCVFSKA